MCHPILVTILKMCPHDSQSKGLFLESLDKVSGPKSCFTCMFAMFAFKIKVSKILKMIKWNYQLTKQNLTGLWARNCNTSQQALISKFAFRPEKLLGLLKNRPQLWKCNPIQLHIPINQLVGKTVYSCAPPPPHGVGTESSFFLDLHVKILGLMSLPLTHHSLLLFLCSFFNFSNYRGGGKSSYLAASKSSSFLYSPIYK